jgi:hypothetical protein
MKNKLTKLIIPFATAIMGITLSSFTTRGEDPIASKTKIVNGQTSGVASTKEFNAGDEIYVCIPMGAAMGDKLIVRLEVDGKETFANDILLYTSESKLNYLTFALAIDPKNHYPEQYFYKEGHYSRVMKYMSELAPGKYKISFGTAPGLSMKYTKQISVTVNVTEEGQKKWKEWYEELQKMDKEYDEKLKQ